MDYQMENVRSECYEACSVLFDVSRVTAKRYTK
jgi:hypothetical protein